MKTSIRRTVACIVLATAPGLAITSVAPQAAHAGATSLPPGFTDSLVATVSSPTAVEGLPDGRVVILDKRGFVRIVKRGVLLPTAALSRSLGACNDGEQGFLGFAVDRGFTTNRWVYLYYTRPKGSKCVNRVSRFTFNGAKDTIVSASELVLLDNIPGTETDGGSNHNGGDLEVGNDGYLYVSIGDSGGDPRGDSGSAGQNNAAQDLGLLSGKIVRIRTNGTTPPSNPFAGHPKRVSCRTTGASSSTIGKVCTEIFAYGLRNPYRFAFDPNSTTTRFFINDVGQNTREEVDLGIRGANYGWNKREGRCPQGQNPPCAGPPRGVTDPLTDYSHPFGESITGGAFVPNGAWPARYDDAYLFADAYNGKIFVRFRNGSISYSAPFARSISVLSHMTFIKSGATWVLYYSEFGTNQVRKIVYKP